MGEVAARVDDGIPRTALESGEVVLAVAVEFFGLGEKLGIRLAAVEERDLVTSAEGGLNGRTTEELRAAQNEELHNPNRTGRPCGFLTASAEKE